MFVPWEPPDNWSYAYLLGAYLGDGYLSAGGQLVIECDAAYPEIIEDSRATMILTSWRQYVGVLPNRVFNSIRVQCSWQGWFDAFPQHGRGRKHERPIVLADWQQAIVDECPWAFLRGLLHSDGCRTINRFKTKLPSGRVAEYEYPRWFFSNVSADIRGLFCATCERVGVRWTQSNERNISVSHRKSVALLDEHVGPKR
jgi:hypothetical protein